MTFPPLLLLLLLLFFYPDERLSGGRGGLLPHTGRSRVSQSYSTLHPAVGAPPPLPPGGMLA